MVLIRCILHAIYSFLSSLNFIIGIIWAASWQNQQIGMCAQQRLRSAWASAQSEQSSLSALRKIGFSGTHWAHSEDSDQTGRMPRLTWVFAGRTCHFVGFAKRRLILPCEINLPDHHLHLRSKTFTHWIICLFLMTYQSSASLPYSLCEYWNHRQYYKYCKIRGEEKFNRRISL